MKYKEYLAEKFIKDNIQVYDKKHYKTCYVEGFNQSLKMASEFLSEFVPENKKNLINILLPELGSAIVDVNGKVISED